MKTKEILRNYHLRLILCYFLVIASFNNNVNGQIIIDHTCIDITSIPQSAFEKVIDSLHIAYAHTSHGSQITTAMRIDRLCAFVNAGGKGLDLPQDILAWDNGTTPGTLDLRDYLPWGDRGRLIPGGANDLGNPSPTQWAADTRTYLEDTANSDINVMMWAWCGQLSLPGAHDESWEGWNTWDSSQHRFYLFDTISYDISEGSVLINLLEEIGNNVGLYLLQMSELEEDFPEVKFVYMTGHLDGTGLDSILNKHNEIIREYCNEYGKILYDFADIETYDPDGNYYGDRYPTDGCNYDANGDGITEEDGDPGNPLNGDRNWALEWQENHTQFNQDLDTNYDGIIDQQPEAEWFYCGSSHSYPLNANLKAYAVWWLWARLAGWEGIPDSNYSIWYIDNTASGINNGTSWTNAWQSFADIVWDSIEPGDVIYISGGEIEKIYTMPGSGNYILEIQKSGTSGNPITIRPGAAHPTLSSGHDGMVIIDGEYNNGCIYSRGNDYITIDGGHDDERKIRCTRSVGIAVYMSDAEGCKILWLHTYQTGTTDNTFGIYSGNTPGMEIAYNDIETPYQDGLRVANLGTIDNYGQWMDIHDNWIHGMGDDGFSGGLSGCNFYNNIVGPWSNTGAGGHPDGMQVYDGVYSKIYNNLFYADVSIGGSNAFIFMNRQPSGPGSHVFDHSRIYNNILMIAGENYDETRFVGLSIGATFNTDINHPEYNDLDDIHIAHNTFVDIGAQAISLESRRAGGDTGLQGKFTNFEIKNNIIYNSKRACCSSGVVGLSNFDIANSSVDFDYNIIHPGTAGQITPEGYQTVNDGGAGFIGSNNIFGRSEGNIPIAPPLFITYSAAGGLNNDLHLSSIDTIARDAGADLSGFTYLSLDKDGNVRPQGASWDIGAYEYTAATNIHTALTENKEILQIYPNPFSNSATIEYTLPEGSNVEIVLYDLTGRKIENLYSGYQNSGIHTLSINVNDLNPGIFFFRIRTELYDLSSKCMISK